MRTAYCPWDGEELTNGQIHEPDCEDLEYGRCECGVYAYCPNGHVPVSPVWKDED